MKKIQRHYIESCNLINQFAQAGKMADFTQYPKVALGNATQKEQITLPDLGKPANKSLSVYTQICVNLYNLTDLSYNSYEKNRTNHTKTPLQSAVNFGIISPQSQKTTASRGKLNLYKAHSTPKACFFMRNNRTLQENAVFGLHIQNPTFHSMVERNGQSLTGCLPCMAVFHPVMLYRQAVEILAVDSENQYKESTQMYQFIFAPTRAPRIKIRILADNEQQARARFTNGDSLLFVGRINQDRIQRSPLVEVKPESVNIHTLPKSQDVGMIQGTTNESGKHDRYFSAIFLSKIHSLHVPQNWGALSYIEFATRLRDRTKAHTRTNQIRRLSSVVDTLSHPITGDNPLLTKTRDNPTMKIYSQNDRTFADNRTLFVSAMGGNHA